MEKEQKFPVNQATVAGYVTSINDDRENKRANLVVSTKIGKKVNYVNVLFSGKQYDELEKKIEERFPEGLGENEKEAKKHLREDPMLIETKGQAYFSSNKIDGVTHQNFSVISSSDFNIPSKEMEKDFLQRNNTSNSQNLEVKIRVNLTKDIEDVPVKGFDGVSFGKTSVAHNYLKNDTPTAMYANLVVPTKLKEQIKGTDYTKGKPVLLTANPQMNSYENKDGKKVYTFNLIAKSMQHNLTRSVNASKAIDSIEKVAEVRTKKERVKVAEKEINNLAKKAKKPNQKGQAM